MIGSSSLRLRDWLLKCSYSWGRPFPVSGHAEQNVPRCCFRSSQELQSNFSPTARSAPSKGSNRWPLWVRTYSTCGGLPGYSCRIINSSRSMSRSRPTSVRLLIGCNPASSSVVRLGPDDKSRTTSMVHLSPINCNAPETGQPSPSRRRTAFELHPGGRNDYSRQAYHKASITGTNSKGG